MSEHVLKTWPAPFAAVLSGEKRHEIRKADRPFAVGDVLQLREWDPAPTCAQCGQRPAVCLGLYHGEHRDDAGRFVKAGAPCASDPKLELCEDTVDQPACDACCYHGNEDGHCHPYDGYTGRSIRVRVTYLSAGGTWGLPADLCVMSVEVVP